MLHFFLPTLVGVAIANSNSRNTFSYDPVANLNFNKDGKLKILQVGAKETLCGTDE